MMFAMGKKRAKMKPTFIRQWRKHRGYTLLQLAERSGLSEPFLSLVERGERQYTQDLLEILATVLQCAPADLLVRDPSDPQGIWSVWDQLQPVQQRQLVEIGETIKRTGTDG